MADEVKKSPALGTPAATTTAATMKTQAADPNQFKAAYTARQAESQGNINSTMDKSLATQTQGLKTAFDQNVGAQNEATEAGQNQFRFAKEDLDNQYDRVQRGMDSFADVRNLNRQQGSQQSLMLGRGRATAAGRIAQQQEMALEESQRQRELLENDYKNRVAQAVANNDYRMAAALLDDFNNRNNWLEKNAAQMASFGNFAGYEQLYGKPTASMMQQFWAGSNPEIAYNTGLIDAARYRAITGRMEPDYVPPPPPPQSSSGGGGGYDWWHTVQGQMALGKNYADAYAHASGGGSSGSGQ